MRREGHFISGAILASLLLLSVGVLAAAGNTRETMSLQTFGRATTGFIENRGQLDDTVLYYAPGSQVTVYFTAEAIVFDFKEEVRREDAELAHERRDPLTDQMASEPRTRRGCAVWIRFEGVDSPPTVEARSELATRYNYFLGDDPGAWRTNVPAYSEVVYRDLWPGIDLVYRHEGGKITYEIVVAAGADPKSARFVWEGAESGTVGEDGSWSVATPVGSIVDLRPVGGSACGSLVWHDAAVGSGETSHGSSAPDRDGSSLLWGTFLGGSSYDRGDAITVDPLGNALVTGRTYSSDFPTTPGAYDETLNSSVYDVFVSKLDASGSALLWSTFLGGSGGDYVCDIAVDPSLNPVVVGWTTSWDFPTTPGAYDQSFDVRDAFVAKLDASGSVLLWSTFLGGSDTDQGHGLALDSSGNPLVTGWTVSWDFPTTAGAYDQSYGISDAFVAKLDASGSALLWSTFLGGRVSDFGRAIALDPSGNAVVTGRTGGYDFPTTPGAYDESFNGDYTDVFVAKLDASGSTLLWSTFLGGGGQEEGYALAVDSSGNPVVTGRTYSSDFPTTLGAYDESHDGACDVFVAKLDVSGSSLLWGTFLGGGSYDWSDALALDPFGNPVVVGYTRSPEFPTTPGAYDESLSGGSDAFVTMLDASGSGLLWSTFLGGGSWDEGYALALGSSGTAVVTGMTSSIDFPTTAGAHDESYSGGYSDGFVAKLGLPVTIVPAAVDFIPNVLNCRGHAPYVTCFIELPEGYNPVDIDVGTVVLNDLLPALLSPTSVGDHDENGILDRMVKFNRSDVLALLPVGEDVEVTVSGQLTDGTAFTGADSIRVICKGPPIHVSALHEPDLRVSSAPGISSATITYALGAAGPVSLRVYDVSGRLVRTLVSGDQPAGQHEIVWDERSNEGRRVGAGVYFIRLERGDGVSTAKTIVLR